MKYEEAMKNCIFRFVSGSHAYGTSTPESDMDYRGVFIAPLSKAFDLFQTSFVGSGSLGNQLELVRDNLDDGLVSAARENLRLAMETDQGDLNFSVGTVSNPVGDEELQELRKFLKLAAGCNPNIIEFLYVESGITHTTPIWEKIRAKRDLFLNKNARHTFSGYAIAQLRRIKTHRGYLMNPPKSKPARADFGLPEETVISTDLHGSILAIPDKFVVPEIRDIVKREKEYREAKKEWDAYEGWSRKRNKKRQDLESKYGYDTKHAMHLVRLIRMAKEILTEKAVKVMRPDREELLAIRNGAWSYEKLLEVTENADAELAALYESTDLRDKPDHKGIAALYSEIAQEFYGIKLG